MYNEHIDLRAARETYIHALEVAKNCGDGAKAKLCDIIYSDIGEIVNAAVELLVSLAESTDNRILKNKAYSILKKHNISGVYGNIANRVYKVTTIEDISNAYENFANANLKMLADLAAKRKIAVLNNSKTPFIDALENDNKISSEDARNAREFYNAVCEECDDRLKFALLQYICNLNSNNELLIFALDTLYSIGKATKDENTKNNIKNLFNKYNFSVDGSNDRKVQKLIDSYNDTMSRMVFVEGVK